jgi:hypothetical protein
MRGRVNLREQLSCALADLLLQILLKGGCQWCTKPSNLCLCRFGSFMLTLLLLEMGCLLFCCLACERALRCCNSC